MKRKKIKVTESSGNVFLDLGFPPQEAHRLLVRCRLLVCVRDIIERRKLTQAKAAKLFGVTQPRISDLTRGKIDRFSIDMLITMLYRAGVNVGVTLEPRKAA